MARCSLMSPANGSGTSVWACRALCAFQRRCRLVLASLRIEIDRMLRRSGASSAWRGIAQQRGANDSSDEIRRVQHDIIFVIGVRPNVSFEEKPSDLTSSPATWTLSDVELVRQPCMSLRSYVLGGRSPANGGGNQFSPLPTTTERLAISHRRATDSGGFLMQCGARSGGSCNKMPGAGGSGHLHIHSSKGTQMTVRIGPTPSRGHCVSASFDRNDIRTDNSHAQRRRDPCLDIDGIHGPVQQQNVDELPGSLGVIQRFSTDTTLRGCCVTIALSRYRRLIGTPARIDYTNAMLGRAAFLGHRQT